MKGCRPLTDAEITRIKDSFTGPYAERDRLLVVFGIRCGFRITEMLSVRVGDVYKYGKVLDRVTVQRRHMKRKVEGRSVVLHPEVQEAIRVWIELMGEVTEETFLFRSQKGRNRSISRQQAWRILEGAFEANRLTGSLGCHSLRKTFADRVYEKLNRDLIKTQRALSHRNVNSTVAYLSFKEEEVEEAILSM